MLRLFLESCGRYADLIRQTFLPPSGLRYPSVKRLLVMLLFLPLFAVVQLIHWVGFLLDEIFYADFHQQEIRKPVFVLGIPRSGTTFLHRTLAENRRFTTFSTWECLFALSITQRKFWLALGRLDRFAGAPLAKLLSILEARLLRRLDGIHQTRLADAEEDYLALMPILGSFILILPFPHIPFIWTMGAFDRDMSAEERQKIMHWYRMMLQKHLYVFGEGRQFLSKNAAFASLCDSLDMTFPDAKFIVCHRDPVDAIQSQISAIQPGVAFFDAESQGSVYPEKMTPLFVYYYHHLFDFTERLAHYRVMLVEMSQLQVSLRATVEQLMESLSLGQDEHYRDKLVELDQQARQWSSQHVHSATGLRNQDDELRSLFESVYDRLTRQSSQSTC